MTIESIAPAEREDLYSLLVEYLRPAVCQSLESAGPGQRLRITSLPETVMDRLCQLLQEDNRWVVRVLAASQGTFPWKATATKLIELRNALESPLLVFIPPGLRTAAEDSLDIATFNELSLDTLASSLAAELLGRVAQPLLSEIVAVLAHLREQRHIRNTDEIIEYLLTVIKNGGSAEAAGGSLYLFGLLPDFKLFSRGNTLFWLSRNINAAELLSSGQPIQTVILRLPLRANSIQSALFGFLRTKQQADIRSWSREIAIDSKYRELAFDRWEFTDTAVAEGVRLIVEPLQLPRQVEDPVAGSAQLPVLDIDARDPLKISFKSLPPPSQASGWRSWRVQILSIRDGSPTVAWESNSYPKPQKQAKVSRSIKTQDLHSLEEGTYFLKVDAYDADGALLTTARRVDEQDPSSRGENESELFLVVRGTDVPVEPDEVRSIFVSSLIDAWVRVAIKSLSGKRREPVPQRGSVRGRWDEPMGTPLRGDVHFELEGDGFNGFSVVVPSALRRIERDILLNAENLGLYSVSFLDVRSLADVEVKMREAIDLGSSVEADAFRRARRDVFLAIYQHHFASSADRNDNANTRAGLVETVDLVPLADVIERYAAAYVSLVESANAADQTDEGARLIRALAHLDAVELRWRHMPGDPGRAILIAPTHPVRLLWHLRHTQACADAVRAWDDGTRMAPDWRAFLNQLSTGVVPINLPMVIFDRRGRGYVEHAPLTHFWPLYLPDRSEAETPLDAVAARDRVSEQLGIRSRSIVVTTIDIDDVASRLFEYLTQHPYVEQLRINVFNPGDGRLVADVLRRIEYLRGHFEDGRPRPSPPSLRYAIQLFAAAEFVNSTGDGLESLLDPDRQVGEDDEFSLSTSNHLLPKLVFARNPVSEFLQNSDRFAAHVSILLEQFVVQGRVGRIDSMGRGSFVGGLVQEPETRVELSSASHFGWVRGLRPFVRQSAGADEATLCAALTAAQRIQAVFATGQRVSDDIAPVVALQLDSSAQALLKQVHDVSDWVLTLDRNLGLDYFDSPSSSREAGYLLDFAPEYLQEDRQRILLTTRSHVELENLVRPIMNRYGLVMQPGDEVLILETLRSLSGRLALRLESGRNQAAEVVGLLLARWLLDRAGLLDHRIVIPLDAHRGWFAGTQDQQSQRRADLLLVGFAEPNTLRLDVVEVKLRDELSSSARTDLYSQMRRQTENTIARLRYLFAQDLYPVTRADGLLRAKELASALGFYVRRAIRYELMSDIEASAAFRFIERLDEGYHLDLRSIGVVFEHKGRGFHLDEEEPGFPVHRFGGDKASQLLAYAAGRQTERITRISERTGSASAPRPESPERQALASELTDREVETFRSALTTRKDTRVTYTHAPSRPSRVSEPAPPLYGVDRSGGTKEENDSDSSASGGFTVSTVATSTPNATPRIEKPAAAGDAPSLVAAGGPPVVDILLGASELTSQYGVLGKSGSQKIGIDLNGCNTISLFGVQGFGKSYTLGVIAEMASTPNKGVNVLPSPLATVIFHYHKSDAYAPEYASAVRPNQKAAEVARLLADYGAEPMGLRDVVLLAPEAKVDQRKREFPGITVEPIKFSSSELGAESWKFLLGAYGNDSLYIRQLVAIMRRHREGLTVDTLRREITSAGLPPATQRLADDRLNLAAPYIDDNQRLGQLLRPGRTVIVDLRDEWIEKDEALGLFVVMLRIFAGTKFNGKDFNKLVVFDEAHKYITESDLIGQVVETIREMRHQATSVVIASQDPLSVPRAVIELTSILLLHRMTSPQWLKHLKTALIALEDVEEAHLSSLGPGEALVWAQRSTERRFTQRPTKIHVRPRFTQHGGGTKTAVQGDTIR